MTAAGAGSTGLPLWAVCVIAFVAILGIALVALLAPLAKRQRDHKQARLQEVYRYRVLGAVEDNLRGPEHGQQKSALLVRLLALVDRMVRARGQREKLLDELERAGMRIRPEEWAAILLIVPFAALLLGGLLLGIIGAVVGVAAGWLGCRGFIRIRITRYRRSFEDQLPDALQLLGGALRTGFALNQAMTTVVREGLEPVSVEFSRVLQEVRIGANLEDALDGLAGRMRSYDLKLVVMAIRTSREVGGNLAEVLQTTVATMRERTQLRGEVRTLTAEGRLSAKVLTALPILMAIYLLLFKKEYLKPLYTTGVGLAILTGGGVLLVAGSIWLHRMTKIEV